MQPIAPADGLRAGDVVHHPAFGFATVMAADDRGAELKLTRDASPKHASRHALSTSWRKCRPGGLLARHVLEPEAVRALGKDDPVAVLGLLLADLGRTQPIDHAHDWMRQFIGESDFAKCWAAVISLAGIDDRFQIDGATIALADGVGEPDFSFEAIGLDAPDELELTPLHAELLPLRSSADAPALWASARALATQLAAIHARGETLLRDAERALRTTGGWVLGVDPEPSSPAVDVQWAARHFCRHAFERQLPEGLDSDAIVDVLPAAVPALAPELLGVLRYALADDARLRPQNGVEWAAHLAIAEAAWLSRTSLPPLARAGIRAGFDTHIGTVKSLSGQANQDAFLLLGEPEHALFCVCDGISTATAGSGDLASSLCVRTLRLQWAVHQASLRTASDEETHKFLIGALDRANKVICEAAERIASGDLARQIPMGTTVVVGVTRGNTVRLAALGDSRAWVVGRHGVAPLLYDQNLNSVRLRQLAAGVQSEWDDDGYALVGYLGHFNEMAEPMLTPPDTLTFQLLPGEWLIIASDGLSDHAADEEARVYRIVEETVRRFGAEPSAAAGMTIARRLVLAANEGGGGDNITVLAITLSRDDAGPVGRSPVPS